MKIIDNKKDFYDYVVGEYGIDDLIVFDRRKAVVIKTNVKPEKDVDYFFSTVKGDKDVYQKEEISYVNRKKKIVKKGILYKFTLKTGRHLYQFVVERYLIDDTTVCVNTQLIDEIDDDILYPELVLAIIPGHPSSPDPLYKFYKRDICKDGIIVLPILKGTVIPAYVSAKDVFLYIYSYLSSKKEKKIEDNRSDVMKLQSAGFDKIKSFRNIK
jgi:hypothetical protein